VRLYNDARTRRGIVIHVYVSDVLTNENFAIGIHDTMSDATKIHTDYVPDSHLPPGSLGEVSFFTDYWQRRFRKGHDKDGVHNDPLVPHAWAICDLSGLGALIIDAEGITSVTRIGAGLVEVVLINSIVVSGVAGWQLLGWPNDDAGSGVPYYPYEDPSAKDDVTSRLQIIDKTGNAYDITFALAVYGLRG
jgi:hypothetical protein